VTVDQLLTQRGGLPPNVDEKALEAKPDPQSTPAEQRAVVAAFALARRPAQVPGTFVYSNLFTAGENEPGFAGENGPLVIAVT
jgi:CubicO group peptidase (beta-lactamase class C family)